MTNTVDPVGGSYAIEALTDDIEQRSLRISGEDRSSRRNACLPSRAAGCRARFRSRHTRISDRLRQRSDRCGRESSFRPMKRRPYHSIRSDPELEREQIARLASHPRETRRSGSGRVAPAAGNSLADGRESDASYRQRCRGLCHRRRDLRCLSQSPRRVSGGSGLLSTRTLSLKFET